MEEIIKEECVKVTKRQYVAFDGEVFDTQYACLCHEMEKRREGAFKNVPRCKEANGIPNFFGESMDYHYYEWYRPRNMEDINMLNDGYLISAGEEDIGRWICIETADDETAWYTTLSSGIKDVRNLLSLLGYDIVVTERKS